uniref:Disease resistance protein RGA2 n=1 Tax=Rhizophora mucronata TaxID=61149 RepID=A0A2P2MPH3_RHIMU
MLGLLLINDSKIFSIISFRLKSSETQTHDFRSNRDCTYSSLYVS